MLGKVKSELQRLSGIKFSLQVFRATLARMARDRNVSIEAVSKALRHRDTKITERWYARMTTSRLLMSLRGRS